MYFNCYIVLDCKLCYFISKFIGDEKNTFKFFMVFNIMSCGPVFRVVVESQIMTSQQSFPHNDTLMTRIHGLGFDTICRTVSCVISAQN